MEDCILNDINSKHCDCVNQGVINLLLLNVCGLIRRSQYPAVIELINKYEILCFVETKTDDADKINIPGFDVIMKNRFKMNRTKSVGIVLAFKKHLGDVIHPLESDSKYVLWFKVDKQLFRMRQDVIFGIVYIPPENSIYCTGDPFSEMENEFLNYSANYENICLVGDFNARTAEDLDYTET